MDIATIVGMLTGGALVLLVRQNPFMFWMFLLCYS